MPRSRAVVRIPLALALLLAPAAAHADLCLPGQPPTPGCQLAPPGNPPAILPQDEAALRAKARADYNASHGPSTYQQELQARYESDRRAYLAAVEAARPPAVPVRYPTLEAFSGFRFNFDLARKDLDYAQAGPEIGFALRLDEHFVIQLPVSLMQSWGSFGRWATIGATPSLLAGVSTRDGYLYVRGGPDVLVPTGASGAAPNVLVGANLGIGFLGYVASLGDGGFVGLSYDMLIACRGGLGGPASPLDTPRCSGDFVLGIRLAY